MAIKTNDNYFKQTVKGILNNRKAIQDFADNERKKSQRVDVGRLSQLLAMRSGRPQEDGELPQPVPPPFVVRRPDPTTIEGMVKANPLEFRQDRIEPVPPPQLGITNRQKFQNILRPPQLPEKPYEPPLFSQESGLKGTISQIARNVDSATGGGYGGVPSVRPLANVVSMALPETKPFQYMSTGEKMFTLAEDVALSAPWGAVLSQTGRQLIKQGVKQAASDTFTKALNTGLDKWIATQGRLTPESRSALGNLLVKDRAWLIEKATNNMLARKGKGINLSQAVNDAVEATIRDVETAIIPRGTQTGAMKFGGLPAERPIVPPTTTPELAPSTSVQTGLAGLGKETAQVKMFEEVSGKGSSKGVGLFDVAKLKAMNEAKPLKGQTALPIETKPTVKENIKATVETDITDLTAQQEKRQAKEMKAYEKSNQLAGLEESLKSDQLATMQFKMGTRVVGKGTKAKVIPRNVDITNFISLKEQSFPEYFTVKQAEAIVPYKNWAGMYPKGHIPRNVVLDDMTKELGMSADEIADRVMAIRNERRQIKSLRQSMPQPKPETTTMAQEAVVPSKPSTGATMPEGLPTTGIPQSGLPEREGGVKYNITLKPQKPVPPKPPKPPVVKKQPAQPEPPKEYPRRKEIIEQAREQVLQDRPGAISNLLQRIPGIKQARQFERPALKMAGDKEYILTAGVAENQAGVDVLTDAVSTRFNLFKDIERGFGKKALQGGRVNVKFVGTPEEAANPLTNTLKDIADNPELYELTPEMKQTLKTINDRNNQILKKVVDDYGAKINKYPTKPDGAYLPNVDASENMIIEIERELRPVARGESKPRFYPSARARMAEDESFVPEFNVQKLIDGLDNFKAGSARGMTFREVIGGKTKQEVIETTHPALAKQMQALKDKLVELRKKIPEAREAIADFENSPLDTSDLEVLNRALNDRELLTGMAKESIAQYETEIKAIKTQIDKLKPAWEIANIKPYRFVQEGIYRYFPAEDAKLITEIRRSANNRFLQLADEIRATAFSGDTSPITGIQLPIGFLADPVGQTINGIKMIGKGIKSGNMLYPFSTTSMANEIKANPAEWADFFTMTGRAPSGTPSEYVAGFLGKIPGVNKFTEGSYTAVVFAQKDMYDRMVSSLVKKGVPPLRAKIAAADQVSKVFPLTSATRLGQSQSRAQIFRSIPTSYSFMRKPAEEMADATRGFIKLGTGQKPAPKELLAVKTMATMAISILALSATSAYITSKAQNKSDEEAMQAILDAINPDPNNGNFATIRAGNFRIPLGGPYRAFFRAVFPKKVDVGGTEVYIPFYGLWNYYANRINPMFGTQLDLVQNKDYYGNQIVKGELPERILRGLWYEVEGAMPLTLGTVSEGLRTGQTGGYIKQQAVGQFAGVNLSEVSGWTKYYDLMENYAQEDYEKTIDTLNATESKDLQRKHPDLERLAEQAKITGRLKIPTPKELLNEVKETATETMHIGMDKQAQALQSGTISRYDYDKERARLRAYLSGQSMALYAAKNIVDTTSLKKLEASQQPEDKALSEYLDYQAEIINESAVPLDWDLINRRLALQLKKYSPKIQKYIEVHETDWIKDLPPTAKAIETERLRGLQDESWFDDYYTAKTKAKSTTTPSGSSLLDALRNRKYK